MAFSKIILNGTTLMDATTATASADDIIASKTAMLSDGEMTTGTGSLGYTAADFGDPTKPVGAIKIADSNSAAMMLANRSKITEVDVSNSTFITDNFFINSSITKLIAPLVTDIGANGLNGCKNLQYIVLPKGKVFYTSTMANCTSLLAVDFGGTPSSTQGFIRTTVFSGDTKLSTVVLRGDAVWTLNSINDFVNTPFASGKTGGTLYVPQALIADYQAATNWSTILGYENNQILPIEGSIYETQYADGTAIDD